MHSDDLGSEIRDQVRRSDVHAVVQGLRLEDLQLLDKRERSCLEQQMRSSVRI